jgi:hypothetical protein
MLVLSLCSLVQHIFLSCYCLQKEYFKTVMKSSCKSRLLFSSSTSLFKTNVKLYLPLTLKSLNVILRLGLLKKRMSLK